MAAGHTHTHIYTHMENLAERAFCLLWSRGVRGGPARGGRVNTRATFLACCVCLIYFYVHLFVLLVLQRQIKNALKTSEKAQANISLYLPLAGGDRRAGGGVFRLG